MQNVVQNAAKARKLREEILKNHKDFDQIKANTEACMVKSSLSTKEDVRAAALERMNEHNQKVSEGGQGQANLTEVDGETCLQHEVDPSDSLPKLSLMYGVSERDIRNKNGLFSD